MNQMLLSILLPLLTFPFLDVSALYEDQVFKFDWRQQYIGKVAHMAMFPTSLDPVFMVGTERNVIAALDADSGRIIWRHKFEEDPAVGRILTVAVAGKHTVSVSGGGPNVFLRIWEPLKGGLVQEHYIRLGKTPDLVSISKMKMWSVYYEGPEIEIVSHNYDAKKVGEPTVLRIKSEFNTAAASFRCVVNSNTLVCVDRDRGLFYVNMNTGAKMTRLGLIPGLEAPEVASLVSKGSTVQLASSGMDPVTGVYEVGSGGVGEGRLETEAGRKGLLLLTECPGLGVVQDCAEQRIDEQGTPYCFQFKQEVHVRSAEGMKVVKLAEPRGRMESVWADCGDSADPSTFQLVMGFEDGSLVSVTPRGNIMFIREEGLASIQTVQMVAKGVENNNEMKYVHHGNIMDPAFLVHSFINRLKRHVGQVQSLLLSVANLRLNSLTKSSDTPDRFGLRKVIVAVTQHNKVYGIDSMTGKHLWQIMFPGEFDSTLQPHKPQTFLLVQKDGRSGDYAEAVLVFKHARSVHFMLIFDPLTGVVKKELPIPLPLDQALLLPEFPEHELRPILLVGRDGRALVHPANAAKCLREGPALFVATTNGDKGGIVGNTVNVKASGEVTLSPVWSLLTPNTEIISISSRHPDERIHSAGRVLADRSVLFKYMNPNLAVVTARGVDSSDKAFINIYLIDLVTGRLFYTATHKKVLPPFHAIHSENWAIYSFFNDKARRTEIVSLELYEGKTQSNTSMFSSIENTVTPLVEKQAYILPTSDMTAVRDTITEQGITSKHLLIGTGQGAILDLPLHMVDPRRPALNTPPHLREPGIPPYIPELPIPSENIINYNQTILGVRGIATSPSGLESTTLVLVYGLDLYGTRVTPSRGFDLLKDDFDYLMITGVIAGLVVASHVTKKLSQKKMLSLAWK